MSLQAFPETYLLGVAEIDKWCWRVVFDCYQVANKNRETSKDAVVVVEARQGRAKS